MSVPMVNLRPLLAATEAAWRANLARMFERSHFILGEQVDSFEREFAAAMGAKFAVAVGTGTSAIELGLRAARLPVGSEVIVPALTSLFTAQAVLAAGCRPRLADVDPETLLLEARTTKRTRAIIPVHLYGQPCPVPRMPGVAVVQDACQAHGASHDGRAFTRSSPYVAYSFYPTKNLPCLGDGGAILTDSGARAARLRLLRDGGRCNDQVARIAAINSRLDEMHACYLLAFLPHLAAGNAERVRLAELYDRALRGVDRVRPVRRMPGSVCHLYVVRAPRREQLRKSLAARGIMTGVHYPVPLHLNPAFADCKQRRGELPNAERACREILSLPLWPGMHESAVDEVVEALRRS